MRILSILFSAILLVFISSKVSAAPTGHSGARKTCRIVTGYGTAIGYGSTALEAKEQARLNCGTNMIDQYVAQRQNIPESAKDDLALACVNLECQ